MIVIVGAGYAGAATAAALARRGLGTRVTLLEAEGATGRHASGQNAGLVSALFEEDDAMAAFAAQSIERLRAEGMMRACGSIRLAGRRAADALLARSARLGLGLREAPLRELAARHPWLAGVSGKVALVSEREGEVHPEALLEWCLDRAREGGVQVMTGTRVTGLELSGGRVAGVRTEAGILPASLVANAAGAWADTLPGIPGPAGLTPYRRHIFVAIPTPGSSESLPWVWDVERNLYARMAGDRLWLCWCDETPHPAAEPSIDPEAEAEMRRRFQESLPAVAGAALTGIRVCLRTFAADRRCVIGPDPRLEGLFWIAGLGGTGATVSLAAGELAAGWIATGSGGPMGPLFDPGRLVGAGREP